ncbi:DUF5719 family protein [Propioniciclava sp.]|uniref:DUF5719 family protein n=1 Tax=Propioniciclava sp. TaxID=2038686 RepID=UPI002614D6FD|nr:DUF5719 family protein [Propioniciclava sp.]
MRWSWTSIAVAGALAAATVAVGATAPAWTPPADTAATTGASVERACPGTAGDTATTRLAAWAEGGVTTATLADPAASSDQSAPTWDAAAEVTRVLTPADAPAAVTASAWAADGPDRGLSAVACPAALGDAWFVGVRSDAAHTTELFLTNLDSTPAEVSLTILGADGRVAAAGTRGIQVNARTTRTVALGPLLDSGEPATIRVETTAGRVASVVRERAWDAATPRGALWLGATAAPAASVVVPGIPGGAGERTVVVTNPGDRVATVSVDVLGDAGAIQVAGAETLELPAQTTRTLNLAPGLAGHPASVRLSGSREVLAAVRVTSGDDPATASAAVVPAATGFGSRAAQRVTSPEGTTTLLVLANPSDGAAPVRILATGPDGGRLKDEEIVVPANGAVEVGDAPGVDTLWQVTTDAPGVVAAVLASGPVGGTAGLVVVPVVGQAATASGPTPVADPHAGT